MKLFSKLRIDPGDYKKPATESIRDMLTEDAYRITQENAPSAPLAVSFGTNLRKAFMWTWSPVNRSFPPQINLKAAVAGRPSHEEPAVVERKDWSHGMRRTEVRSRAGNSHLGHVFTGDQESPNGVRYCINSASLRFVPYAKMEAEGYGYLLYLCEE